MREIERPCLYCVVKVTADIDLHVHPRHLVASISGFRRRLPVLSVAFRSESSGPARCSEAPARRSTPWKAARSTTTTTLPPQRRTGRAPRTLGRRGPPTMPFVKACPHCEEQL